MDRLIEDRIIALVRGWAPEGADVRDDVGFQDIGVDSVDLIAIIIDVEDEFSIEIDDDNDVPRLLLVKDFAVVIREKLAARPA
jgi:acyl carrier protein